MNITSKDITAATGRLLLAALFLLSGFSKLTGPAATIAYIESSGLPFAKLAYLGALGVELGLASLLVLGLRTRLVAAAMAVFTVMTAVAFHNALSDQAQFINFFKNISIAGGLLQVAAFGGGMLSLDVFLVRRKTFALAR